MNADLHRAIEAEIELQQQTLVAAAISAAKSLGISEDEARRALRPSIAKVRTRAWREMRKIIAGLGEER